MIFLFLYDILFIIVILVYLPYFFTKGKYHKDIKMRFGYLPKTIKDIFKNEQSIWIHAVSVGEVIAAKPIVEQIKKELPFYKIVISTTTKTGNDLSKKVFSDINVIYFPLDISFVINKVISILNPKIFISIDTEIWPNLTNILSKGKIPIVLLNGRISPKSFKNYMMIKFVMKKILNKFSLCCMQTQEDAKRIIKMGADKNKVKAVGSVKFEVTPTNITDAEIKNLRESINIKQDEVLLIAGSTHKGEETLIIQAYSNIKKDFDHIRLLIAPRHIERIDKIKKLINKYRVEVLRFSQIQSGEAKMSLRGAESDAAILLDTIGELSKLYYAADIVIMGGSFIPHGGQNPIEPASAGKPIIVGPNVFNFADIYKKFIDANGCIMVRDIGELQKQITQLLQHTDNVNIMGNRAMSVVEQNKGAAQHSIKLVKEILTITAI